MQKKKRRPMIVVTIVVIAVAVLLTIAALIKYSPKPLETSNKIGVISIRGPITLGGNGASGGLPFQENIDSGTIISFIESASADKNIKAIILNINSPGGTVVASKEIVDAVKKVDKPVVALIREVGASGAYWIASAADLIVADPLSVTGSVGVAGGYLEFSDLISEYGVEYHSLKTGRYKDLGNPFVDLSPEGRGLLQKKLDIIHEYFVDDVSKNRGKDLKAYGNGLFYLGKEAKEIGLIDELGGKDEAVMFVKELAGIKEHELVFYRPKASLFDVLSKLSSNIGFSVGQGIGSQFLIEESYGFKLK